MEPVTHQVPAGRDVSEDEAATEVGGLPADTHGLEILGVIGILIGFWYPAVSMAAMIGFVLLLGGAIGYHARAGDYGRRTRRGDAFAPPVLLVLTGVLGTLLLNVY